MKKGSSKTLEAKAVQREVLSPSQFVNLPPSDRSKIKQAKIVPPTLGKTNFGGVLVEYNATIYKVG